MPIHADAEGVIKYHLEFMAAAPPDWDLLQKLEAWRRVLFRLGLIGQGPYRYGGLAYGNVSRRAPGGGFLISGSQTGGLERLDVDQYCRVTRWDAEANRLVAEGPVKPSSEALTHGAAYAARPSADCVLHVHSPELWRSAARLSLPVTDPATAYGTPAMAEAIAEHLADPVTAVIAMGGHLDGILAVGDTIDGAAFALLEMLGKSLLD